jgi:inositol monophosphatase 3
MAPMGIRLSPLGLAVFCLLGLYHLYSGFLTSCFSLFGLGSELVAREAKAAFTSK